MPPFNPALIGAPSPVGRGGGAALPALVGSILYASALPSAKYSACNGARITVGPDFTLPTAISSDFLPSLGTSNVSYPVSDVDFGGGVFVAVASSGTIYTSTDGKLWSITLTGNTVSLNGVAYGGSDGWVAVGGNGSEPVIFTSPDGFTWTKRATGIGATSIVLSYVKYFGSGLWSILSRTEGVRFYTWNGSQCVARGALGATSRNISAMASAINKAAGGLLFAGIQDSGSNYTGVVWSTDGINWTETTISNYFICRGMTYDGNYFVLYSYNGGNLFTCSSTAVASGYTAYSSRIAIQSNSNADFQRSFYIAGVHVVVSNTGFVGISYDNMTTLVTVRAANAGGGYLANTAAANDNIIVFAGDQGLTWVDNSKRNTFQLPNLAATLSPDKSTRLSPYMRTAA